MFSRWACGGRSASHMMKILVVAYACEPLKGSEPGAGWQLVNLLAEFADVHTITRRSNEPSIENSLNQPGCMSFSYVDLPEWLRFWKKGNRGVRLYYLIWQFLALSEARRQVRNGDVDLVWHATLSTVWLGSVLPWACGDLPFIWGPVGGGVKTPKALLRYMSRAGRRYERSRAFARWIARHLNPLCRIAWRNSTIILAQNQDTIRWLPARHQHKAEVLTHVIVDQPSPAPPRAGHIGRVAVYAGRLISLKCVSLAVEALVHLSGWTLLIFGDGAEKSNLFELAKKRGVEERVQFRGWVSKEAMWRTISTLGDVFLFPSAHEEGGWAVVEAIQHRLPVVCFDVGGPPAVVREAACGVCVEPEGTDLPRKLAEAVQLCIAMECRQDPNSMSFMKSVKTEHIRTLIDRLSRPPGKTFVDS